MKGFYKKSTYYKLFKSDLSQDYIVLIHGLGLNHQAWIWQLPFFRNYNVLVYDLIGHGASAATEERPSLKDFSLQLHKLLDDLEIQMVSVVGFSLGAMIARSFSTMFPKKVQNLIMLNSPNKITDGELEEVTSRSKLVQKKGPSATVNAALERWYTPIFRAKNTHLMTLTRYWIESNDREVYSKIYPILYFGSVELKDKFCYVPSLVLTCREDFANGPDVANRISQNLPNSRVVVLDALRHMAIVEDPKSVNDAITHFLQS